MCETQNTPTRPPCQPGRQISLPLYDTPDDVPARLDALPWLSEPLRTQGDRIAWFRRAIELQVALYESWDDGTALLDPENFRSEAFYVVIWAKQHQDLRRRDPRQLGRECLAAARLEELDGELFDTAGTYTMADMAFRQDWERLEAPAESLHERAEALAPQIAEALGNLPRLREASANVRRSAALVLGYELAGQGAPAGLGQQHLAGLLGVTRKTAAGALAWLEDAGLIEMTTDYAFFGTGDVRNQVREWRFVADLPAVLLRALKGISRTFWRLARALFEVAAGRSHPVTACCSAAPVEVRSEVDLERGLRGGYLPLSVGAGGAP